MTIKQLILKLKEFDQDKQVFFSCDEEGNVLHPTAEIILTNGIYGKDENKKALVIYPLNTDEDIT